MNGLSIKPSKILLYLIFVWMMPQTVLSQQQWKLQMGSSSGYEYNVFNVHPSQGYIVDGVSESALQSGYFQHVLLGASYKLKRKKHQLFIQTIGQMDYFPLLPIVNLYRPTISLSYRYKYSKFQQWSFKSSYGAYITNRVENQDEVLRPPRSYQRVQLRLNYELKPFRGNISRLEAHWRHHRYNTEEMRLFYYRSFGLKASMEQSIFKNKTFRHSLALESEVVQRMYTDIEFDSIEDEENMEERLWRYAQFRSFYSFTKKRFLKTSVGVDRTTRLDIIQERFGYTQNQCFVKMRVDNKKMNYQCRISAAHRVYHDLMAAREIDEPLVHNYFRGYFKATRTWNKKLDVYLKIQGVHRTRNYSEVATSFLAYTNGVVRLGIVYRW